VFKPFIMFMIYFVHLLIFISLSQHYCCNKWLCQNNNWCLLSFLSHDEKNETNSEKINKVRYYQARNLHRSSMEELQDHIFIAQSLHRCTVYICKTFRLCLAGNQIFYWISFFVCFLLALMVLKASAFFYK
jgi:hypothetical protein